MTEEHHYTLCPERNRTASILAAVNKVARGYMFTDGSCCCSSFLANCPCDQTADHCRVKSIPVLRTYVWHE